MYRTVGGHWYREKWRLIKSSSVETELVTDTVAYMSSIFSNHSVFFALLLLCLMMTGQRILQTSLV